MKIDDSVYYNIDRRFGAEVSRGNNGGVDINVGVEV